MNEDVAHRLAQADRFAAELATVADPTATPSMAVHAAYYAMFHAASAVVAAAGHRTARTHNGLNNLLARVLRERSAGDLDLVRDLTRAFEIRILVDYDDGGPDPGADAIKVVQAVPSYLARCREIAGRL